MKKTRILYIEDDRQQRTGLTSQLRSRGFTVRSAVDGVSGLRSFSVYGADVILCDLNMPSMNGLQVLKKLRKIDDRVPVIISTAHGTIPLAIKAIQSGAFQFMLKPLEVDQLTHVIVQAVKNAELEMNCRESAHTLNLLMDNIPDIVFSLDIRGKIIGVNSALKRQLGFEESEVLGRSMIDLVHGPDRQKVKQFLKKRTVAGAESTGLVEYRMETKNREIRVFETKVRSLVEDERAGRLLGIARDVTDRKRFEAELRERTISLQKANSDLEIKAAQLETSTFELARANIEMLRIHETLERKNHETEALLKELSQQKKVLEQADEQLRVLVNVSPVPFLISRISDGCILYVNKPAADLVGLTVTEIIGKETPDFYADIKDRRFVLEQIKKHGSLKDYELRICKTDGSLVWMILSLVKTEISGEAVLVGALYDINTRKEAEEKLRLYREIYRNSNDGVAIIDPQGQFIERNPAHYRFTGFTLHDLRKSGVAAWTNPKDLDDIRKTLQKKERYRGEMTIRDKKGKLRDIDLAIFPIYDENKKIHCYAGVARDISARKHAEEALRVSEARFRSLVENAHDIIFSIKPDGTFTYLSPQFEKHTGLNSSTFYGKSFKALVHPDDYTRIVKASRGGTTTHFDFRVRHKNGEWRWFTSHITAIHDDAKKIIENIGIAHDMDETKRLLQDLEQTNQELRTAQAQLVQSEKMAALGNLVAGIAHEINTPVGAINSMHNTLIRAVSKLKEEITTGDRKISAPLEIIDEANKVIQSGTERVATIVRRLRSFARLDEAELKDADIHEGLEDTLTLLHHEIKHGIKVIKNFGPIPRLDCYPGRLNQVFLNILLNAKQAIAQNGEITITTYAKDSRVFIEIEDNGIGIPEKNLPKIFDPGYTTKGVGVGTGLGLSICYQIINDHQGEILVQSQVGKGTKFTIILPTDLDRRLNTTKRESSREKDR